MEQYMNTQIQVLRFVDIPNTISNKLVYQCQQIWLQLS